MMDVQEPCMSITGTTTLGGCGLLLKTGYCD